MVAALSHGLHGGVAMCWVTHVAGSFYVADAGSATLTQVATLTDLDGLEGIAAT